MARTYIEVDLDQLRELAGLDCTQEEAAAVLGMACSTLQLRLAESPDHRAAWDDGRLEGCVSLRRLAHNQAARSPATAIFLMKNRLGYTDKTQVETSGPNGGPIQIEETHRVIPDEQARDVMGILRGAMLETAPEIKDDEIHEPGVNGSPNGVPGTPSL